MSGFKNSNGLTIIFAMIKVIQKHKQYLSDIDGAIGDGDHGINMSKGFSMCVDELCLQPGNFSYGLKILSRILINEIGGSMGPLYGVFFKAMARICGDIEVIDAGLFGKMLKAGEKSIQEIGNAEVGDKTLIDVLSPASDTFLHVLDEGKSFTEALLEMKLAAVRGRDSTINMIARMGRSSRLGERSR
jgi:phosphoenolpyruvate---glycerone phosphotransferase subunit DhaL